MVGRGKPKRVPAGVSLVELMVTLAVLAIISGIAAQSFINLIRGNRLASSANELVATMQAARVAAVSNRTTVSVCPSTNGSTCSAAIGRRWIALMAKGNAVLRETTLHSDITVNASANLAAGNNTFVFAPSGFSRVGGNASGSIGLCSPSMTGSNDIDVSASVGRISTIRRAATTSCTAPADN